ncbi:MAG TPA: GyrI-like domain-containing protein, partial [Lachnospiraceae bacterium]|nr:GyrI-like domain-containing protein [Lachnospiraceae bacterium]
SIKVELKGGTFIDYRILNREAFDLCILPRLFDDISSAYEIPAFWTEYLRAGLHEIVPARIGLCPQITSNSNTFQNGFGCDKVILTACPPNFELFAILASTWAVFTCTGAMPNAIQDMWKRIYKEWLPQASYELVNDYDFEYYPPGNMQSENNTSAIWIPVQEKRK